MPRKHFTSITVKPGTYDKFVEYCNLKGKSPTTIMEEMWEEREKLIFFATQIKKIPESVRTYT